MKVLFVSSGNSETGISSIVEAQGISLQKAGIDVEYFPIKGKGIKGYLSNVIPLRNYLKSHQYDLIHAHYGLCGIVAILSKVNQKLVVSFMGDDLLGSKRPDGTISIAAKLFTKLNIFLIRYFYDHIIVKSHEMANVAGNYTKLTLLPNGVNLTLFSPLQKTISQKKIGFCETKKHIIFVSNPSRSEKNYSLAVEAIGLLPENNLELHAVHGVTTGDIVYHFNAADALLITSFHEGSPNVVKEAMACNCPIVATDVGDVRWVIGETDGCYITSFDPDDVASKILQALKFAEEIGKTNGRERIIQLGLDSESIAKRILEVYSKLMKT